MPSYAALRPSQNRVIQDDVESTTKSKRLSIGGKLGRGAIEKRKCKEPDDETAEMRLPGDRRTAKARKLRRQAEKQIGEEPSDQKTHRAAVRDDRAQW